ncbi:MAG TPA: nuclear transport factor 2 family protein [Ohtaekwangia sp.]
MKFNFTLLLIGISLSSFGQKKSSIPQHFTDNYYASYSGVPTADKLTPFYADSIIIDDPTYDWVGKTKLEIFRNFDRNNTNNHYTWRIDQQIIQGDTLMTEGLLKARYAGIPYDMRFVNIFHFKDGKIIRQYDYFDNKDWYTVVDQHNHQKNKESDEAVLRNLKQVEWPKAYREQDTVLLDRILADEFQLIDSDGEASGKKDQLDYIKQHKPTYLSFEFRIERLDIFENNTAVVSGTGTIRNKDKKGEYNLIYKSSNVLIKRNGIWKAISSHTSGDKIVRIKK